MKKQTMSITKKILAGLGVVALTAGSIIVTPAKAQACDIACQIELTQRHQGSRDQIEARLNAANAAEAKALAPVTKAPAQNTGESILSDHFRRLDCTIAGQCGGRRVEYTPRQRAWMNCKETFRFQDAHKICGGFPLR